MTDLPQRDAFDLDRLAMTLGALPEAPLAMPVQQLETALMQRVVALFQFGLQPQAKAGN